MRSADSIKTKIARVMASYKEANEKLNGSGRGLEGIDYTNFQEYVVTNICPFYFQLDPVLKNRPNVQCWHSNDKASKNDRFEESVERTTHDDNLAIVLLSSDEEELSDNDMILNKYQVKGKDDEYEKESNIDHINNTTTNPRSSSLEFYSDEVNNTSEETMSSSNADDRNTSSETDSTNPPRPVSRSSPKKRLTPSDAKKKQRQMCAKKKKSFIKKKDNNKIHSIGKSINRDNRKLVEETRDAKMKFEMKKHDELKSIEAEKLKIEKERLQMDRDNNAIKQEHISAQTKLENTKIVLLKLEMFKERQRIKKENPELTEDYLDEYFPYPV